MSDDEAPKSAVELAMEKLRASGFEETKLTDDQKAEIAELRSRCRASIAELETVVARWRSGYIQSAAEIICYEPFMKNIQRPLLLSQLI